MKVRSLSILATFLTILSFLPLQTACSSGPAKSRVLANTTYTAKPFNFQSLMTLISPKMTSVDQVIPLLPDNYKKYFTLMFQSGSLQSASPASPRVIAYGSYDNLDPLMDQPNYDQLYLAFQTDPKGPYGNTLEAIEWVPSTKSFQFYQIDFPITPNSVTKNPLSCNLCHGTPLRPNWSSYPRWDGAFGNNNSLDGKFGTIGEMKSDPTTEQTQAVIATLKSTNDRLKPMDFSSFFAQSLEYPDAYLSDKVSSELKPRDVAYLRSLHDYKQLKYALAGAFLECTNFDQFFSPALANTLRQGVFNHLKEVPPSSPAPASPSDLSFAQILKATFPLIQRNGVHLGNYYDNEVYITAWLRFIFEGTNQSDVLKNLLGNPLNKHPSDTGWTYDFVGFASRITALRDEFLSEAQNDYPTSMALYPNLVLSPDDGSDISFQQDPGGACKTLAALSRKSTANYTPPPPKSTLTAVGVKPITGMGLFKNYCSTCHGSGPNILPLDDVALMKAYRSRKGESVFERLTRQEMPPRYAPQPNPTELKTMTDLMN